MGALVRWGVLTVLLCAATVARAQTAAEPDPGAGSASASDAGEAAASGSDEAKPEGEGAAPASDEAKPEGEEAKPEGEEAKPEPVPEGEGEHAEPAAEPEGEHAEPAAAAEGEDEALDAEDDSYNDPLDDEPALNSPEYLEEYGEPYIEADFDGDGKVSPEEEKEEADGEALFGNQDDNVDPGEGAGGFDLCAGWALAVEHGLVKDDGKGCQPVEIFRAMVRFAKKKVLARLEAKVEQKAQEKMAKVSWLIFFVSLGGFLLLFTPLFVGKKYPGKAGVLWKYSAVSAITFFVTINLFGAVLMTMRGSQAAVGKYTNPQIAIAGGLFDTLDHNAEDFTKFPQLFGPALKHMQGATDEQPAVTVIANGQRLLKDAKVFLTIAKMFKRVSFIFGILPIVLLGVTILLFVLAIKPTLMEIVKLPMHAAEGGNAGGVVKGAMSHVFNEAKATAATIGVLIVISIFAGAILGRVIEPALQALLAYFVVTIAYLFTEKDASSGLVFLTLFSVIFFLVLNLAVVILSMSFYLGKAQKIFQQRFSDKLPLGAHKRFWKWGTISLVWAQLFPLAFMYVAQWGVDKFNDKITEGDGQPAWGTLMLGGPLIVVVGFLVFLWATQGVRSLMFLAKYKPKQVLAQYRSAGSPGA